MSLLKKLLNYIFGGIQTKGSFAQNLAISFSGNALAQVVGFAFTPFIARLYGPEVYGIFALFVSVVNTISPISTLQFPAGYVVANPEDEFYRLLKITLTFLMGFTALAAIVMILFGHWAIEYFKVVELKDYLFLIPVYIFFMGFDYHLIGWNTKEKEFQRAAISKLVAVTVSKVFTLLVAILGGPLVWGMILGNLFYYPVSSIGLTSRKISEGFSQIWSKSSKDKLLETWKKFRGYPLYVTPGLFISGLSLQLPIYFFSVFFNATSVGYFALANGVISAPLSILINSSNVVFLQKAAETRQNSPHLLGEVVLKLYKRMMLISVPPLVILAFISKWLFSFIFGQEWEIAGVLAAFISLSAMFIVNGPLSTIFRIMNWQRLDFYLNILFVTLKALALIPGIFFNDIILSVISYSFVSWLCSCISLIIVFRMVSLDYRIILRDAVLCIVIFAFTIFVYR